MWFTAGVSTCRSKWPGGVLAAALALVSPAGAAEPVTMAEEVSIDFGTAGEPLGRASSLDCASPASCWEVATVFSVAINLNLAGHHKRCAKRCRLPATFVYELRPGAYEIDGGFLFGCPTGMASIGSGTIRPKRRRLNLVPDSPDEVDQTLRSCFNGQQPKYSSWVRIASGGTSLRGKTGVRGRSIQVTPIGEGVTRSAFKGKHNGVPIGSPTPPYVKPKIPICPDLLSVSCKLVVQQQ